MTVALGPVKALLEDSVDAAVILDSDRRILYYNRAYAAATELSGRELKARTRAGLHCYDVFPLEICETACAGNKARQLGRSLRMHEISAAHQAEEKTFIVTAAPLDDDHIIEIYRDVTADVRIQKRLKVLLERERNAKEHLEREVAARSSELRQAHAQLIHQEKMSSLGRLVAGIAHELNNPINFVYGNIDFLAQYMEDALRLASLVSDAPDLSPALRQRIDAFKEEIEYEHLVVDARKLIRSIRSGAERTAGIVRDLKTFSRPSATQEETDVVAAIDTTLSLIAPLIKGRVQVDTEIPPNVPCVIANAGHIGQVLMNILTNAAEAIEGAGRIRVTVTVGDDDSEVAIAIADTGTGIPLDIREKIVDPFFTTKEVGEGTGLGLWISENIIRSHGGTLTIASEVGRGSTFTIRLPVGAKAPGRPRTGTPAQSR
ncbi:MAG TPA: ATP-binding protein [Kofleriaceae bacterium]|nr:ATP-binding protein [Kofleriaceae bacterium]